MEAALKSFRRAIKEQTVKQIAKKALRAKAEELPTKWFSEIAPALQEEKVIAPGTIERYSELFGRLLKLSSPNNLRTSYIEVLDSLLGDYRPELIFPSQTAGEGPSTTSQLETMLAGIADPSQSEYLAEAVTAAKHQLFRAAAILGWCSAIDQVHHALERIGFDTFNKTSGFMTSQSKGRFKKFNQTQNVSSISEVREVFDPILLWIIEGMQLIDINQHTRLRSCFELRCQCAHPGEAPVSEYNLLSFFSDIKAIVFENPKLAP